MKLRHAIRHVESMIAEEGVHGTDLVAIHVLVELAKKVERVQKPLRQLERALCPTEDLSQGLLFDDS
jgi:hypothetical protein